MLLDNRTLLFSLMLVCGLTALSLALVSQSNARDGLRKWAAALALEAVAWSLIAARGVAPDLLSILGANLLMSSGLALKLAAIYEYRKWPCPKWQCLSPVALTALVFGLIPSEDFNSRVAFGSLIFAGQLALLVWALHDDAESREGRAWRLLFGATVAMPPLLLLRSAAAFSGAFAFAQPHTSVAPNPLQLVIFVFVVALGMVGSLGFILMIKERGDREIRKLAMTDPLTGLYNRRAFMDQAEREMAQAQRNTLPLSLLMIDIDHFKRTNDEHGHAAGDAVLSGFAALLVEQLRRQDTVGRYGGEEFCVLLPATDQDGALVLAEKLRSTVAAEPLAIGAERIGVTVSIGVRTWHASECTQCRADCGRLLEDADQAMYQAKHAGRNRIVALPLRCMRAQCGAAQLSQAA